MPASEVKRAGRGPIRANDAERTKTDILDVATAHFASHGLSGSRVDEIAEQTNTSKRMLYYYFGSKEGLYRAVLSRSYNEIRRLETEVDLDSLDPEAALAQLVAMTFDWHRLNPDFVRIVMVENTLRGAHIGDVPGITTRAESVIRVLGRLLERGVERGAFRAGIDPIDLHLTISALSFYNISNSYTVSRIFSRDFTLPEVQHARRATVVEIILKWVLVWP
ncbi:TetR family transcriptional regulator [Polymorphobacter sp. PAMC 29334]|uniref:TetR/AcrR family transcriptional regulator n=1 Tax=Polymorphobacter sp. PAMC 29334 TaxID=2862331 RepID=UPI001C74020E|nr:TetR/AcrR family transcriptional regulator [Polymorphobacter sp. PAMC 29334]QYE36395.1 TetR family transcriptional regulator [Polymorphobacter sp. PAMC 29334]